MRMWHYLRDGRQEGPVTEEELYRLLDRGAVSLTALVWTEGMPDWKAAREVLAGRQPAGGWTAPAPGRTASTEPYGFHVSTVRFVVLMLVSFGMFAVYWMYRNWRFIRDSGRHGISPFWRAFFNVLWVYDLFRSLRDHPDAPATRVRPRPAGALAFGYITMMLASNVLRRFDNLQVAALACDLLGFSCLLPFQAFIVEVNRSSSPMRGTSRTGIGLVILVAAGFGLGFLSLVGILAAE